MEAGDGSETVVEKLRACKAVVGDKKADQLDEAAYKAFSEAWLAAETAWRNAAGTTPCETGGKAALEPHKALCEELKKLKRVDAAASGGAADLAALAAKLNIPPGQAATMTVGDLLKTFDGKNSPAFDPQITAAVAAMRTMPPEAKLASAITHASMPRLSDLNRPVPAPVTVNVNAAKAYQALSQRALDLLKQAPNKFDKKTKPEQLAAFQERKKALVADLEQALATLGAPTEPAGKAEKERASKLLALIKGMDAAGLDPSILDEATRKLILGGADQEQADAKARLGQLGQTLVTIGESQARSLAKSEALIQALTGQGLLGADPAALGRFFDNAANAALLEDTPLAATLKPWLAARKEGRDNTATAALERRAVEAVRSLAVGTTQNGEEQKRTMLYLSHVNLNAAAAEHIVKVKAGPEWAKLSPAQRKKYEDFLELQKLVRPAERPSETDLRAQQDLSDKIHELVQKLPEFTAVHKLNAARTRRETALEKIEDPAKRALAGAGAPDIDRMRTQNQRAVLLELAKQAKQAGLDKTDPAEWERTLEQTLKFVYGPEYKRATGALGRSLETALATRDEAKLAEFFRGTNVPLRDGPDGAPAFITERFVRDISEAVRRVEARQPKPGDEALLASWNSLQKVMVPRFQALARGSEAERAAAERVRIGASPDAAVPAMLDALRAAGLTVYDAAEARAIAADPARASRLAALIPRIDKARAERLLETSDEQFREQDRLLREAAERVSRENKALGSDPMKQVRELAAALKAHGEAQTDFDKLTAAPGAQIRMELVSRVSGVQAQSYAIIHDADAREGRRVSGWTLNSTAREVVRRNQYEMADGQFRDVTAPTTTVPGTGAPLTPPNVTRKMKGLLSVGFDGNRSFESLDRSYFESLTAVSTEGRAVFRDAAGRALFQDKEGRFHVYNDHTRQYYEAKDVKASDVRRVQELRVHDKTAPDPSPVVTTFVRAADRTRLLNLRRGDGDRLTEVDYESARLFHREGARAWSYDLSADFKGQHESRSRTFMTAGPDGKLKVEYREYLERQGDAPTSKWAIKRSVGQKVTDTGTEYSLEALRVVLELNPDTTREPVRTGRSTMMREVPKAGPPAKLLTEMQAAIEAERAGTGLENRKREGKVVEATVSGLPAGFDLKKSPALARAMALRLENLIGEGGDFQTNAAAFLSTIMDGSTFKDPRNLSPVATSVSFTPSKVVHSGSIELVGIPEMMQPVEVDTRRTNRPDGRAFVTRTLVDAEGTSLYQRLSASLIERGSLPKEAIPEILTNSQTGLAIDKRREQENSVYLAALHQLNAKPGSRLFDGGAERLYVVSEIFSRTGADGKPKQVEVARGFVVASGPDAGLHTFKLGGSKEQGGAWILYGSDKMREVVITDPRGQKTTVDVKIGDGKSMWNFWDHGVDSYVQTKMYSDHCEREAVSCAVKWGLAAGVLKGLSPTTFLFVGGHVALAKMGAALYKSASTVVKMTGGGLLILSEGVKVYFTVDQVKQLVEAGILAKDYMTTGDPEQLRQAIEISVAAGTGLLAFKAGAELGRVRGIYDRMFNNAERPRPADAPPAERPQNAPQQPPPVTQPPPTNGHPPPAKTGPDAPAPQAPPAPAPAPAPAGAHPAPPTSHTPAPSHVPTAGDGPAPANIPASGHGPLQLPAPTHAPTTPPAGGLRGDNGPSGATPPAGGSGAGSQPAPGVQAGGGIKGGDAFKRDGGSTLNNEAAANIGGAGATPAKTAAGPKIADAAKPAEIAKGPDSATPKFEASGVAERGAGERLVETPTTKAAKDGGEPAAQAPRERAGVESASERRSRERAEREQPEPTMQRLVNNQGNLNDFTRISNHAQTPQGEHLAGMGFRPLSGPKTIERVAAAEPTAAQPAPVRRTQLVDREPALAASAPAPTHQATAARRSEIPRADKTARAARAEELRSERAARRAELAERTQRAEAESQARVESETRAAALERADQAAQRAVSDTQAKTAARAAEGETAAPTAPKKEGFVEIVSDFATGMQRAGEWLNTPVAHQGWGRLANYARGHAGGAHIIVRYDAAGNVHWQFAKPRWFADVLINVGGVVGGRLFPYIHPHPTAGKDDGKNKKGEPESSAWTTARVDKDPVGQGHLFTVEAKAADAFQDLAGAWSRFPALAHTLGIRVEGGRVTYPDAAGLNARIDAYNASRPAGERMAFRPRLVDGEITDAAFLALIGRGEIPLARTGAHHFHDLSAHLPGYMALPEGAARPIQERARALSELRALVDQGVIKDETFKRSLADQEKIFAETVDRASHDILDPNSRAISLSGAMSEGVGPRAHIERLGDGLRDAERAAFDGVAARVPDAAMPGRDVAQARADIRGRLAAAAEPAFQSKALELKAGPAVDPKAFPGGAGGVISAGKTLRPLVTKNLKPSDLPYETNGPRAQPVLKPKLPAKLEDVARADVARVTDIGLASEEHSGSAGLVRLAYLADGRPVVLKTYYLYEHKGVSRADELPKVMLEEARATQLYSELGVGPKFHGVWKDADGRVNVVMDVVRGDFGGTPVKGASFRDLEIILARMKAAGITNAGDFQMLRNAEGRLTVIDGNGAAEKLGAKPMDPWGSSHGFDTRARADLLREASPEDGREYLSWLRANDPAAHRGLMERLREPPAANWAWGRYPDLLQQPIQTPSLAGRLLERLRGRRQDAPPVEPTLAAERFSTIEGLEGALKRSGVELTAAERAQAQKLEDVVVKMNEVTRTYHGPDHQVGEHSVVMMAMENVAGMIQRDFPNLSAEARKRLILATWRGALLHDFEAIPVRVNADGTRQIVGLRDATKMDPAKWDAAKAKHEANPDPKKPGFVAKRLDANMLEGDPVFLRDLEGGAKLVLYPKPNETQSFLLTTMRTARDMGLLAELTPGERALAAMMATPTAFSPKEVRARRLLDRGLEKAVRDEFGDEFLQAAKLTGERVVSPADVFDWYMMKWAKSVEGVHGFIKENPNFTVEGTFGFFKFLALGHPMKEHYASFVEHMPAQRKADFVQNLVLYRLLFEAAGKRPDSMTPAEWSARVAERAKGLENDPAVRAWLRQNRAELETMSLKDLVLRLDKLEAVEGSKADFPALRARVDEAVARERDALIRDRAEAALSAKDFDPAALRAALLLDPKLAREFTQDVGVNEGYTLGQHTEMVQRQFERYLAQGLTAEELRLLRVTLLLHDAGKPAAVRAGDKELQHKFTVPILHEVMGKLGFTPKEIALAEALVDANPIAPIVRTKSLRDTSDRVVEPKPTAVQESVAEIKERAKKAGVTEAEYLKLALRFYVADVSAYTKDAGGVPSMENLFVVKRDQGAERGQLRFSDQAAERLKPLFEQISGPTRAPPAEAPSARPVEVPVERPALHRDTFLGRVRDAITFRAKAEIPPSEAAHDAAAILRANQPDAVSKLSLSRLKDAITGERARIEAFRADYAKVRAEIDADEKALGPIVDLMAGRLARVEKAAGNVKSEKGRAALAAKAAEYKEAIKKAKDDAQNAAVAKVWSLVESRGGAAKLKSDELAALFMALRHKGAHADMVRLFDESGGNKPFHRSLEMQELLGVALNKTGKAERAETVLRAIPGDRLSGEALAILGKAGKVRYDRLMKEGKTEEAARALDQSIADLELGFAKDFEVYPGMNLVYNTITRGVDLKSTAMIERGMAIAPLVYRSAVKAGGLHSRDFWTVATMMETALISGDRKLVAEAMPHFKALAKSEDFINAPLANLVRLKGQLAGHADKFPAAADRLKLLDEAIAEITARKRSLHESLPLPELGNKNTPEAAQAKIMLDAGFGFGQIRSNLVAGNVRFKGQLHDTVVSRWDVSVAEALLGKLGLDKPGLSAEAFIEKLQPFMRERFNTHGLERDLKSPEHDVFDGRSVALLDFMGAPKGSTHFTGTNLMADAFLGALPFDCRGHAYFQQFMFDVWKSRQVNGHLKRAMDQMTHGDREGYAATMKAIDGLESLEMRVYDSIVDGPIKRSDKYALPKKDGKFIYDPEAVGPDGRSKWGLEDHTWNGLLRLDKDGRLVEFRQVDSFYQQEYRFGGDRSLIVDPSTIRPDGTFTAPGKIKVYDPATDSEREVSVILTPTPYAGGRDKRSGGIGAIADDYGQVRLRGIEIDALPLRKGQADVSSFFDPKARAAADAVVDSLHDQRILRKPEDIVAKAEEAFRGAPVRVAVAGYSASPDGYAGPTTSLLGAIFDRAARRGRVGVTTSPTLSAGSIDAMATSLVHARPGKAEALYVTAKDYLKYIESDKLPEGVDRERFMRARKFYFEDAADYSRATALASNSLIVVGGRDVTVSDFVNAVRQGNRVVIFDMPELAGLRRFDEKKGRPDNGGWYLIEQLAAYRRNKDAGLPLPEVRGLTKEFLAENWARIEKNVLVLDASDAGAVEAAARHIGRETPPLRERVRELALSLWDRLLLRDPEVMKNSRLSDADRRAALFRLGLDGAQAEAAMAAHRVECAPYRCSDGQLKEKLKLMKAAGIPEVTRHDILRRGLAGGTAKKPDAPVAVADAAPTNRAERELVWLEGALKDKDFAQEAARRQDAAYYEGQGQEAPRFLSEADWKKTVERPAAEEKIAMNLAGFYAVESGVGVLAERGGRKPVQIIDDLAAGKLPKDDMLLLARFANATWKAGQPFRALDRITRDTFRPAARLTPEELAKDFDQITAAGQLLSRKLEGVRNGDRAAQLAALDTLLKSRDFAAEMAAWQDGAYYRGQGKPAPEFLTEADRAGTTTRTEAQEKIATNLAGFYAVETGVGLIAETRGMTPRAVIAKIADGTLPEADMLMIARFANATWKAGQPFRGLNRIERDTFRTAANLTPEELKKDFVQIRAGAKTLLDRFQAEEEKAGKPSGASLGRSVLSVDGGNLKIDGKAYDGHELQVFRDMQARLLDEIGRNADAETAAAARAVFEAHGSPTGTSWHDQPFGIVLRELVVNGMQAAQRNPNRAGKVTMEARVEGDRLVVVVADDGPGLKGISEKDAFTPGKSTKRASAFDRIGNGLAYSRAFVEQVLGGTLTLENPSGAGARFRIEAPLKKTSGGDETSRIEANLTPDEIKKGWSILESQGAMRLLLLHGRNTTKRVMIDGSRDPEAKAAVAGGAAQSHLVVDVVSAKAKARAAGVDDAQFNKIIHKIKNKKVGAAENLWFDLRTGDIWDPARETILGNFLRPSESDVHASRQRRR